MKNSGAGDVVVGIVAAELEDPDGLAVEKRRRRMMGRIVELVWREQYRVNYSPAYSPQSVDVVRHSLVLLVADLSALVSNPLTWSCHGATPTFPWHSLALVLVAPGVC